MATLYRKKSPLTGKKLPSWYCFFRVPSPTGGTRQVHRSTGKATKNEAATAAAILEREALAEAGAGDAKSAAILQRVKAAAELAMRGRLDPARARALIGEIIEVAGDGESLPEFTVKAWAEGWLAEKKVTTSPATHAAYKTAVKRFLSSLGIKAERHLETVTAADVRHFRDSIREAGRTGKTANVQLKIIRSCFADAVKAHAILRNPATNVSVVDEDDSVGRAPFTIREVRRILKACPTSDWRGATLFGVYGGLRLRDATNLVASSIDLEKETATFIPAKTKRKNRVVSIPLHPEIVKFFTQTPLPQFPGAPLFPSLANRGTGGKSGLSKEFLGIMASAKVPRTVTEETGAGAPRKVCQRSFHALRHTATSLMASAGVAPELRMKITGHSTADAHQQYTHLELETIRGAVTAIPSI